MSIRSIKRGIKNLWIWFPIIWKDRNWDQYFLYKLMHFKFKNMEFFFRNNAHFIRKERVADRIKICKLLLERIIKDNYADKMYKDHDIKWGELRLKFVPYKDNENYQELLCSRERVTDKNKEKETKEFLRIHEHEERMKKQDIQFLCRTINKYVNTWWD